MNRRITFKNMEHSANIENFALEKLEKINRLIHEDRDPKIIDMVITGSAVHAHNQVELNVQFANVKLFSHHEGPDVFKEIDIVIDKMLEEIRRAKDKLKDKYKHEDKFKSA